MSKKSSKKVARPSIKTVLATKSKDYSDYAIEYKSIDKTSFKLTCKLLDKMILQSKDSNKTPLLVIRMPKDKDYSFIMRCVISIERKD